MINLKTRIREAYRAFVNPEEAIKCRGIRDGLEALTNLPSNHEQVIENQRKAGM